MPVESQPASALEPISSRTDAHLLLFSISTPLDNVLAAVRRAPVDRPLVLVTPHIVLSNELATLTRETTSEIQLRPFCFWLSASEMEWCDTEADRQIAASAGGRSGRLFEYYDRIRRLKNQVIRDNLARVYRVTGGELCATDLGIEPSVWTERGLVQRDPGLDSSTAAKPQVRNRIKLPKFSRIVIESSWLRHNGQTWLLLGKPSRVRQYMDLTQVEINPVSNALARRVDFCLRLLERGGRWRRLGQRFSQWALNRALRGEVVGLMTSSHEHRESMSWLAAELGLQYTNLQDSYLPSYYPSAYLKYRDNLSCFLVWDDLSSGVARRHGVPVKRWSGFKRWTLPRIDPARMTEFGTMVYLASGAGDWTALKNRSDEDLALLLLEEVARANPDLNVLYRPHPLWLHPHHQGMRSIQRLVDYLQANGPPNLRISQGALRDSGGFSGSQNLSVVASSIDEDIAAADLILGDHSQTMLVAARQSKPICSVNPMARPSFFSDHAELGFPLVRSSGELLSLITEWADPIRRREAVVRYNLAIDAFNALP